MTAPNNSRDMLGRKGLTHIDEALKLLLDQLENISIGSEILPLEKGLHRIVSETIDSPENLPSHSRSTMDGYAVCAADTFGASSSLPAYLQLTGEVLMGENPIISLQRGECIKISTGGLIPQGADSVVMFEHTIPIDETMLEVVKSVGIGTNIIKEGEDIAQGQPAITKGHKLRPQDLGLLAGLGITEVPMYRKLRVGILSTGDEIIPYSEVAAPGKIRNINSIALSGQIHQCGATIKDYNIISDDEHIFFPALAKAIEENDVVLFSGGSSVGTRDIGERAIESLGKPGILTHGVALKPGKPIIIGLAGNTPVFGLPGHPVSAMVCFDFFVKPTIEKISGVLLEEKLPLPTVTALLDRNINSAAGRRDVVRVRLEQVQETLKAIPVLGKSGSISTLSRAHGYFLIDENSQGITENSEVEVHIYS